MAWEQYYHGVTGQDRQQLFSVTKSFLSSLVGIALHEGALANLDQRVVDFFPSFPVNPDNPLGALTLRHLLTMTAGFMWPRGRTGGEPMMDRMRRSPDWAQFILSLPVRCDQIGQFHYCSAASHLLSAILTRAAGQNACEFARLRLFAPLGFRDVQPGQDWELDPQGNSLGGWGLSLSAREVACFGWLYLSKGFWQGKSLVPASWVEESTRLIPGSRERYGYHWWLHPAEPAPLFAGLGRGGQYLVCVPARQLVIVILSRSVNRWPDRWPLIEKLLAEI